MIILFINLPFALYLFHVVLVSCFFTSKHRSLKENGTIEEQMWRKTEDSRRISFEKKIPKTIKLEKKFS
jgi:hypothetical protein